MSKQPKITRFNQNVLSKYQIYNSIFMTLPFDAITKTGVLLPLFHETCEKGFNAGQNPTSIVDTFFSKYQARRSQKSQIKLLFKFIQYIERQVVLFDAIEDAAFPIVNNMDGIGTLRSLKESTKSKNKLETLKSCLEEFKVRIVLTAHPTQFYPGSVLGIITDLTEAIKENDLLRINDLLAQLGKTPFFKHKKPTPYDEAVSLIWYLENVFYETFSEIYDYIQQNIFDDIPFDNEIINIGFWPGGDRDGNPFVLPETTLNVAERLKQTIIKNYYNDVRKLKRKLTFKGVFERIEKLDKKLNKCVLNSSLVHTLNLAEITKELEIIKHLIAEEDYQKVLYVIEEIERTRKAAEVIRKNEIPALGKLLFQTHKGLSEQYEVSCEELDYLVDLAKKIGIKSTSAQITNYSVDQLIGRQIVGICNLPSKNIAS